MKEDRYSTRGNKEADGWSHPEDAPHDSPTHQTKETVLIAPIGARRVGVAGCVIHANRKTGGPKKYRSKRYDSKARCFAQHRDAFSFGSAAVLIVDRDDYSGSILLFEIKCSQYCHELICRRSLRHAGPYHLLSPLTWPRAASLRPLPLANPRIPPDATGWR